MDRKNREVQLSYKFRSGSKMILVNLTSSGIRSSNELFGCMSSSEFASFCVAKEHIDLVNVNVSERETLCKFI